MRFRFDSEETSELQTFITDVFQRLPISAILFIIYIVSLFETLAKIDDLMVVGFVNDINFISCSIDVVKNCQQLQIVYIVYEK